MSRKKLTIPDISQRKIDQQPITMVTAYDYPFARIAEQAGMDILLVGDSLAMVVLGHPDTVSVTMEEMLHHTKAVVRGREHALVIADMPFGSYNTSLETAIANANRLLKEAGADAVKLEGGGKMVEVARAIVEAGIPVQGHLGLTPQTATGLGGFKVQAKDAQAAEKLLEDALALESAGCFSLVLEAIPAPLARLVTETLRIPTIGIGAGVECDGQVLVIHDLLGIYDRFTPRFVKQYGQLGSQIQAALEGYRDEVQQRIFPGEEHSFSMSSEEMEKLKSRIIQG